MNRDYTSKLEERIKELEHQNEQLKKSLRESEERSRIALNSIGDGVISTDKDGNIVQMNPVAQKMTGWDLEDAKGKAFDKVFNIFDALTGEKATTPINKVIKKGTIEGLANHTKLISKEGDEYQIADSAAPIKDEQGHIHGVIAVFRDVTEAYKKNQQIKENKDFLETIFQSIQDGISVLNTDLSIRYVNNVMESWYAENMPLIGKKCYKAYHDYSVTCDPCPTLRCMKTKKTETEIIPGSPAPNSPVKWLELYSYPVIDSDSGEVKGVVEFVRDITKRKETERQLEESENFISALLDNLNVGVVACDAEGILTYFNNKTREFHGLSLKNIPPENWANYYDLYKVDGQTKMNTDDIPLYRALNGEYFNEIEMVIKPKEGNSYSILNSGQPLKDTEGSITGAVVAMHDITERKQAEYKLQKQYEELETTEEELRASNEELQETNQKLEERKNELEIYKRMVESSKDMMAVVDAGYNYICVNNAYLEYYNLKHEEVIGFKANEIIGEKYFEETVKPNLDKCLKGETVQFEMAREFPGLGKVNLDIIYRPLEIDERIEGVVSAIRDINERKEYEEKLIEARNQAEIIANKFHSLVEQSSEMLFLHDLNGYIIEVNRAGENNTGYSREELYTMNIMDVDPDAGDRDDMRKYWKTLSVKDSPITFEARHKRKDGSIYLAEVVVSKIVLENEKYILAIARDITERKHAEEQLIRAKEKAEESDRLKSTFLANMSHEIRTPMNGIIGFSQILKENDYPKDQQKKFIEIIHSRTQHLLNIINDLVDVSKIEANQLTLNFQYFYLNDVMQEINSVFSNDLKSRNKAHVQLRLHLGLNYEESYIKSDFNRFRQVMDNLLKNAIKFTEEGSIEFGYEQWNEGLLLFYVKDSGIGIPNNQQKHIFERFRQVGDSKATTHEGTGLGLTISKNLVELMEGEMWMSSEEGEGSVFYFTLPFKGKSSKQSDEGKEEEQGISGKEEKTILLLEDDPTSREYMKALLEPKGMKLIICETGKEGYEAFINHPEIDLILMDIKLPDANGLELTRKIRSSSKNEKVPIIAQTAYAMSGDAKKSGEAGCNDHISKPIDKDELLTKMSKLI